MCFGDLEHFAQKICLSRLILTTFVFLFDNSERPIGVVQKAK